MLDDPDPAKPQQTIYRNDWGDPSVEVHSVRTALRRNSRGAIQTDLVIEVTQRRRGFFEPDEQDSADRGPAFDRGAGWGLQVPRRLHDRDRHDQERVPSCRSRSPGTVADDDELALVRAFLTRDADSDANAFSLRTRSLRSARDGGLNEPFALLHRHGED